MKNIFKKEKKENPSDNQNLELNRNTTNFYFIIFGMIFVSALFYNFFGNKAENKKPADENLTQEMIEQKSLLDDLKSNNFDMTFNIITDADILKLIVRREKNDKELIAKYHNDIENQFFINGMNIYELKNSKQEIIKSINLLDEYDKTFYIIDNLIKLEENKIYELDLKEENYDIKRYKIENSKVIKIYNEYNKKEIEKTVSGEAIMDLHYNNSKIIGIKLDLTSFYKNLGYDYDVVTYNFKFGNIGEIKLESLFNDAQ